MGFVSKSDSQAPLTPPVAPKEHVEELLPAVRLQLGIVVEHQGGGGLLTGLAAGLVGEVVRPVLVPWEAAETQGAGQQGAGRRREGPPETFCRPRQCCEREPSHHVTRSGLKGYEAESRLLAVQKPPRRAVVEWGQDAWGKRGADKAHP